MRHWGFTGTSKGMTAPQLESVTGLIRRLREEAEAAVDRLAVHLGDCVGADEQAHAICVAEGVYTVGHPPTNDSRRAFCAYDEELPPFAYMTRNTHIAEEGACGLIAAPPKVLRQLSDMPVRSGTWSTVRRALKREREIHLAWPNGLVGVTQVRYSWDCLSCDVGSSYGPDRAGAVRAARRHWRKRHVETGEQDTAEARAEIGPIVERWYPDANGVHQSRVVGWYEQPFT